MNPIFNPAFSKELASKQLADLITEIYDDFNHEYQILSAPDDDHGLFKYVGTSPQAQFYLSKISKKRNTQRPGLGFVIQRAELPGWFRVSLDIEISQEVTGKDPHEMIQCLQHYAQNEFGPRSPEFIIYVQPAHSGLRGWADKTFVGIEIALEETDFERLPRLKKKIMDQTKKLFQSIDHCLTGS
ncbi:MAG TPA: hypothetical protein PKV38_01345 [bacterium]|nr:hypothetical protein [bacterium]